MADMLLSATIYTPLLQNAAAVDHLLLGDDRMSLREFIIASCVGVHFTEVPVKVQISCNLEPCCLEKKLPPARMHEEAVPRTGNRKFIWSGLIYGFSTADLDFANFVASLTDSLVFCVIAG